MRACPGLGKSGKHMAAPAHSWRRGGGVKRAGLSSPLKKQTPVMIFLVVSVVVMASGTAYAMPDPDLRVSGVTDTYATVSWANLVSHGDNLWYQVELDNVVINYPGEFSTRVPHGGSPGDSITFTITVYDGDDYSEIASDSVTVTIPAKKAATVSISGPTTVQPGSPVRLTATVTGGDDIGSATYLWTKTSGPSDIFPDRYASTLAFTAPDAAGSTSYGWTVTVTLANGDTATANTTVTVTTTATPNRGPTANAGPDKTVDEQTAVELFGGDSTDDKDELTYEWEQTGGSPTVPFSWYTLGGIAFTAPSVDAPVTLTFRLTVTDSDNATDTDTVRVTVRDTTPNLPPSVVITPDNIRGSPGGNVTMYGIAQDFDGQIVSYAWTRISGPAVTLIGADTDTATFTVPETADRRIFVFRLTATDDTGASASDTATVGIAQSNVTLVADAGENAVVLVRDRVQLDASGTAYNGMGTLTYTWTKSEGPPGIPNRLTGVSPSFTMPHTNATRHNMTEQFGYTLTVTDRVLTDTDAVYIAAVYNVAPWVTGIAVDADNKRWLVSDEDNLFVTARTGETVTLRGGGYDPENRTLSYSWSKILGPSVTLAGTGPDRTFVAPYVSSPTVMEFMLTVRDHLGATGSLTAKVEIHPNSRPTADAGDDMRVRDDQRVTLFGTATDADGDFLRYSWKQISGITQNTTAYDRQLDFTTPINKTSRLVFEFTVSDGVYESSDRVTVNVQANLNPPVANAGRDRTVTAETDVSVHGSGSDAENNPLKYSWKHVSGPIVALAGADKPTVKFRAPLVYEPTDIVLALTVDDGRYSHKDSVTITVRPPTVLPTVDAGPDVTAREQTTITLRGQVTDRTPRTTQFIDWTHSPVVGAVIHNSTMSTTLVTLPYLGTNTTITFTLTVRDDRYVVSDTVSVYVYRNLPHTAPSSSEVTTTGGTRTTVTAPLTANPDGDDLTVSWSLSGTPSGPSAAQLEALRTTLAAETGRTLVFTPPVLAQDTMIPLLAVISDGVYRTSTLINVIVNAP